MIRKFIIIALILGGSFLLAFVLKQPKDFREVIQFASWGSQSEVAIIKPILAEFEKENPDIRVEFMHIPQNYFQKIHLLFASNTAPDVIFINNHYLPLYANAGLLEPLKAEDIFYEKSLKSLSWNGVLYAIPRDISTLVIFYNKDLFIKKGVPFPQKGQTFSQFLLMAQKLTGDSCFGISFEEDALFYLPYLMSEGGGILSDDLSTIIIDEKESQKGLQFYSDLRKKYHVAPLKSESASATMAQLFLQGRIAMHFSGRWLVPKYREEAKFDWDVVQFPNGDAGSVVPLDSSGWAIAKYSKHKEASKKLVKFLSSQKSIEQFAKSGLIVPARKDVAQSEYFLDGKLPKSANVFLDVIETAKPTPVSVNYREILDNLKVRFESKFN